MPVAMLAGLVNEYQGCNLKMAKDIIYVGIRSFEKEEYELIEKEKVPVVKVEDCLIENMESIQTRINNHFFPDG